MTGKTILIVDDEYDIVTSLELILTLEGHTVWTAFHGKEAMELMNNNKIPDVIFSDIMMPVMNGYDFVKNLKKSPSLKNIPIVLMSSAELNLQLLEPKSWNLFIRKPFDIDRLIEAVKDLTKSEKK